MVDVPKPSIPTYRLMSVPARLFVLGIVGFFVWWWRPLFHPIIYRIVYSPGALLALGIPIAVGVLLFVLPPFKSMENSASFKGTIVGVVFVVGLVVAILVGGAGAVVEERTLAQQTMSDADEIDEFPAINEDNARIVPRTVADVQTRSSVSYRQHRLGESDIARMEDGTLAWSYSIEPDGFRNSMYEKQRGVLLSDMTTMENREMRAYDDTDFERGKGMWYQPGEGHRGIEWNLQKQDYWVQYYDDPVEFVHDGTPYLYFPKTGHEWHWFSESLVPHTTPTWEGGALVHPDGTVEHLSSEETQSHEVLAGQRLYPLHNTEREVSSLGYRNGIVNQMAVVGAHDEEIEVAAVPSGTGNSQPFVIDLADERMSYVMAMEPYGEDTRGLDEVWMVDSRTGDARYYGTEEETLLGPERAMGLIRGADTRTDWNHGEDSGQFEVVEPVPVVVDGELWWHAKVVPTDNTDVTRNSFVSAHTGEVVEFENTEAMYEFLAGKSLDDIDEGETATREPADDEEGVAYYIVITDADGNVVERLAVEPGQEVTIEQDTESDNSNE